MTFSFKFDKLMLQEFAAEVMVYFEKHKLKDIISRVMVNAGLERPQDPYTWLAKEVKVVADLIYNEYLNCAFKNKNELKTYRLPGGFLHRIILYGRPGAGKKIQARALVMRFNLVYIDVESLIHQNLVSDDDLAVELQVGYDDKNLVQMSAALCGLVNKRLLRADCLSRGWVMINFPKNLCEFREVMQNYATPPNRVFYLECPEELAIRRLIEKPKLGNPIITCDYIKEEMSCFLKREKDIAEYLDRRQETVRIDASLCSEPVKMQILKALDKVPYFLGFKY